MKRLMLVVMFIGAFALGSMLSGSLSSAFAFSIILDTTNNYFGVIEEATVSRNGPFGSIFGNGVEFAIGDSANAVFPGITEIGGGFRLDGNRPKDLVEGSVAFTIRVTSNGHLYDALLTYFVSDESGGVGVPPVPDNVAGAVFALQGPINQDGLTPIPEPATLLLFGTTAAGLGLARWRARRRQQEVVAQTAL